MENYDRIILFHDGEVTDITYEEYVMYMASPEKDWDCIEFRRGGSVHRLDGPAMVWVNGTKEWYVNNKCHRLDGPAVELADGARAWYANGKRHRSDGPAIERANGYKEWWVNGYRIIKP